MIFYPTLKSLKQKLQIQPINTGKQMDFHGIVFDDIERLHAMVSKSFRANKGLLTRDA